ncbi:MAG: class I SAM-dependent methyltransferase [Crocinitomicaceae bacterium]|nr:class I SAM-dependent methyltransferase [Crocinitomicaceae bacterium]
MKCKICQSNTNELFSAVLMHKYNVVYYQCSNCDFIQTEEPYWLEEAYDNPIGVADIGMVSRNIYLADLLAPKIKKYFSSKGKFLDYGGGYGLFVRMMRDKGLDFYRQDSYCENLFAKSFDLKDLEPGTQFELLTAFEVFEHLPDPIEEVNKMFELSNDILFSTDLQPDMAFRSIDDWWYFSPEAGQHVSLYSLNSLQHLAKKFNKNFYSDGISLHLMTDKKLNNKVLKRSFVQKIIKKLYSGNPESLLQKDYEKIKSSLIK